MYVVVGLGNPGKDYTNTRHNIGFNTVDLISKRNNINLNKLSDMMSYNPAKLLGLDQGLIEVGLKADLVLVDLNDGYTVSKENLLYKCGWSPLEGKEFHSKITHTFVNGFLAYQNGKVNEEKHGERLLFDRNF